MATSESDSSDYDGHSSEKSNSHKRQRTENSPSPDVKPEDVKKQEPSEGWQMDRNLNDCMLKMFDDQLWTDVTFRCADQSGENPDDRIRAHKNVLAARSPVFQTMFFGSWKDADIEIHDFESLHFEMFLRLLYSDEIDADLDDDDLIQLSGLAHKYQTNFLVDKCLEKLQAMITVQNACMLLERALLYEKWEHVKKATYFIDKNASRIIKTDGFLEISLDTLTHILKGDTFFANEADIFNRSMEWARRRSESTEGPVLRNELGKAFYYLRTPAMKLGEFSACTMRKGFYSMDEYEEIINSMNTPMNIKFKTSNSREKRYSPNSYVRLDQSSTKHVVTKTVLSDKLTIVTKMDAYLTHALLQNHDTAYFDHEVTKHKTSGVGFFVQMTNYGKKMKVTKEFRLQKATVAVTLRLDSSDVGVYNIDTGEQPHLLELREPILLSSGKSYTLGVDMQLEGIDELMLRTEVKFDTIMTTTTADVQATSMSDGVVKSLQFKHIDNRECDE